MLSSFNKMAGFSAKLRALTIQYPLIRGMLSYGVIWPTSSITQEYMENGTVLENVNLAQAARFGIFGAFFMAPVFYGWMKFSNRYFTRKSLRTAATRATIEQICYSPIAIAYFFFGMSLIEFKPVPVCVNEVREKFWSTYTTGLWFWPLAQTLNFYFISERNRIVFVSLASYLWTTYLAHMKSQDQAAQKSPQKQNK